MYVSSKAYKIWKIFFEHPNEWLNLSFISYKADMTNRQASQIVQTMNCANILKRDIPPNRCIQLMFEVTDEEYKKWKNDVLTSFYEIDDAVVSNIRSTLSTVGWTSAQDVALATGYRSSKIFIAISLMDDVVSRDMGSSRVYMIENRLNKGVSSS